MNLGTLNIKVIYLIFAVNDPIAALAHLGERQTEEHFGHASVRYLEVLW